MAYETQPGTLPHRAVEFFKAKPRGFTLNTAELAEVLDFDVKALIQCLDRPRRNGLLSARPASGSRELLWSLGDGKVQAEGVAAYDHDAQRQQEQASARSDAEAAPSPTPRPPAPAKPADRPVPDLDAKALPFNACRYIDGSVIVVGVEVRGDGAIIFSPKQAASLWRLRDAA